MVAGHLGERAVPHEPDRIRESLMFLKNCFIM